jgi:polysaccharide export outer membrane protein
MRFFVFNIVIIVLCVCAVAPLRLLAEIDRGDDQPAMPSHVSVQRLEPGDQVVIWALGVDEFPKGPMRIDPAGYLDLPLVGRVLAAGLTPEELKAVVTEKLQKHVREPEVTIQTAELATQPVSVIGAVNTPGVYRVRGRRTLLEILSLAGGLRADAGSTITVTHQGGAPAPLSPAGQYSVAEVSSKALMGSGGVQENPFIYPNDVISVSRAQMVYVLGDVKKAGGFPLNEHEHVSVLRALALAEGVSPVAAPSRARILRRVADAPERQEVPVNLSRMLAGADPDVLMHPDDILFIPNNTAKKVGIRALETTLQMVTGVVIWRR